jgi:hypothetical protein
MAPQVEYQVVEDCIVILRFQSPDSMNQLLEPISNRVDGPIKNRMGHNFPRDEMTKEELERIIPKNLHKNCKYVIACVKGNAQVSDI